MSRPTAPTGAADRICYLHIGPHKTGTTSIQNALFTHASELEAVGLRYPALTPDKPGRQSRNHTPLCRQRVTRAEDFRTAQYWSEVGERIADWRGSIVVSTEHFAEALRDEARFRKTVDFFAFHGYRIVVVVYVRDQPAWLNSWYTQDQRNFMSRRSFGEFLDDALDKGLVDPWAILRRFIDEGIEIRVVSFDLAAKSGLVASFLKAVGAPEGFALPEPKPSNQNLGVKGVYAAQEIMRRVGFRVRSMSSYPALYEQFKGLMKGRDWERTAFVGASPEDERRIRDRYRESNEAFAREWLGAGWETVCPPRPLTLSAFDFDAASSAEQDEVLGVVDTMVSLIGQATNKTEEARLKRAADGAERKRAERKAVEADDAPAGKKRRAGPRKARRRAAAAERTAAAAPEVRAGADAPVRERKTQAKKALRRARKRVKAAKAVSGEP